MYVNDGHSGGDTINMSLTPQITHLMASTGNIDTECSLCLIVRPGYIVLSATKELSILSHNSNIELLQHWH